MQANFDHLSTPQLQMFIICEENRDRLPWQAQMRLDAARQALRDRQRAEVMPTEGPCDDWSGSIMKLKGTK